MNAIARPIALLMLCALCGGAQANADQAAQRCEAAVTETIQRMRGRDVRDVDFSAARRALSPPADDEIGVKGEGHYKLRSNSVPFTYSCAFNTKTSATSGIVFRETGSAQASTDRPWQPDLSQVSPQACESAVAAVLKDKYPRVENIVFGSETRRLEPAPNSRLGLQGQGALRRAPGMHSVPFNYRCEFDARSGRVLQAQAND